jgi:hypothetical protein
VDEDGNVDRSMVERAFSEGIEEPAAPALAAMRRDAPRCVPVPTEAALTDSSGSCSSSGCPRKRTPDNPRDNPPAPAPAPPSRHQLALMLWLAVLPTLTVLNLTFGDWLATMSPVARTFVLATIAVPIVIYGLMPQLHRARSARFARQPALFVVQRVQHVEP